MKESTLLWLRRWALSHTNLDEGLSAVTLDLCDLGQAI